MNAPAPCAGQWDLFDSTDYYDHRRARQLCHSCPIIDACRQALAEATASSRAVSRGGGPQGTWAGELIGGAVVSVSRIAAEEAMFNEEEARKAHAHWARTPKHLRPELPDRVRVGERVYQRRSLRNQRERKRGEAA